MDLPHGLPAEELTAMDAIQLDMGAHGTVGARVVRPAAARAALVLAHGAGAGMEHPFMRAVAEGLGKRGIATLRYQFPYMERGSKRPDAPAVAQAAVRAAAARGAQLFGGLPLFAGGKSFGGRMTSQAQAAEPLPGVRGLAFLGFPLHAAGQPGDARAKHLAEVEVPMLFLQGTRDALADAALMEALCGRLGESATLASFEGADHSFHVPAKSGRSDAEVLAAVLDTMASWMSTH
jgi:predicted alpha/beta-hydrolase family hydrolase